MWDFYQICSIAPHFEILGVFWESTESANPPNIAQRAKLMPEKTGPGYGKNTLIGGMAAAFLYCTYLVICFLMDDTIKTPEDMEKHFGMLPLTTIPEGKKVK